MRNPKRIKELMNILTAIWEMQPDIRFNQLIHNLQMEYNGGSHVRNAFIEETGWGFNPVRYPDLFYVEDDKFIEFLKEKYNQIEDNYCKRKCDNCHRVLPYTIKNNGDGTGLLTYHQCVCGGMVFPE